MTRNAYDQLLIDLVMQNGTLNDYYSMGGGDYDANGVYVSDLDVRNHVLGLPDAYYRNGAWPREDPCGWDPSSGGLAEEDGRGEQIEGMRVSDLRCNCGKMYDISLFWRATLAEVVHAVFRRLAEVGALDMTRVERAR